MDTYGFTSSENSQLTGLPVIKGTYHELKRLQERHKELLRQLALGVAKKDISKSLGITLQMIRYVEHSALGQEYLEYIRGKREEDTIDIQASIDELAGPAVNVIRQAIAGKMEVELTDLKTSELKTIEIPVKSEVQIKAAQDILSRHSVGFSPRQRGTVEHTGNITHDLGEMISNVKDRAKELNGHKILEAEIESVEDSIE